MASEYISTIGLLDTVREQFLKIPDTMPKNNGTKIPLVDCLLSGLAVFKMKHPSLLKFEHSVREDCATKKNLQALFRVTKVPCDTQMRSRLDEVDYADVRPIFKSLLARVQRNKLLGPYAFFEGHYLVPLDASGHFSSNKVHCKKCLTKNHRDGRITYHHQALTAVIASPHMRQVLPFAPEPIIRADGDKKNDCERNAAKRLTDQIRQSHPKLKMIILGDGLYSNAPFIHHVHSHKMRFILVAKKSDHESLFDWIKHADAGEFEEAGPKGIKKRRYRYVNDVPLNDSNEDCRVNVLQFWETDKNGKESHWTWVTDIELTDETARTVMKGGRTRWRIENETFNSLKNQGYNFEHNYGHGKENLSTNFMYLMMCAFLIDQILELGCKFFKRAHEKMGSRTGLWSRMREMFLLFEIENWEALFQAIVIQPSMKLKFNDSG